ncbi:WBC30 protein, partial [Tachuris rubrigastra]|nr:WBC30 protein [Tachuris rubrigastra]
QTPSGPCEPGYFCTGGAKNPLQQVVMEGHYSSAGAFQPEPCPLGSFQPVSMLVFPSLCRDCPEGTFCHEPGLAAPQDCPKGHFCSAGSSFPLPCPVGTYSDVVRAGSCKPCPAGMFCSTAGLAEPEGPCQPGYYCSPGSSTSSPVRLKRRCPPGFYCPQKTGINFYPCPPGTYNPSYGLSQAERCQQCPAGEEITLVLP